MNNNEIQFSQLITKECSLIPLKECRQYTDTEVVECCISCGFHVLPCFYIQRFQQHLIDRVRDLQRIMYG